MVSSGAGGRAWFACRCPGYCALIVFTLLCCVAVYLLFGWFSLPASPLPFKSVPWLGHRAPTATPFVSFIDPDLGHLQHMFHSIVMVKKTELGQKAPRRTVQSAAGNVTVFHGQEGQKYNTCVPFHAPANRTLRICVYEREVDQMISSYIQDYGVWEKEQVEGMAYLLRRDHADKDPVGQTVSATVVEADRHVVDADHSRTHQNVTMSPSGRAGAQARRLSMVDVGCNVGVYTMAAASLGHEVLALDPLQSNLQLLDTSLRLADLRAHVTLLLNAVTDLPGPVRVHVNTGNIGGSSVSQNKVNRLQDQRHLPKVWALCLSQLVPLVPTRRLLLKLDIEGWEARALRCAGSFFQQLDVSYVLMEWLFFRNRRVGADVIDFMIHNGLLPYSDVTKTTMLSPSIYHSWPDNVWWMKR